jgi:hypothetical protein
LGVVFDFLAGMYNSGMSSATRKGGKRTLPLKIAGVPSQFIFAAERRFAEGFVYFFRRRRICKIGFTCDLPNRLRQLEQEALGEECGLVHLILSDEPARLEREIHEKLIGLRVDGEWFDLSRAVGKQRDFIAELLEQGELNFGDRAGQLRIALANINDHGAANHHLLLSPSSPEST